MTHPKNALTFILPRLATRHRTIARVVAELEDLPMDCAWRVQIESQKSQRSHAQNRFLFGVAYPLLSDHLGYEKEEIHTYVCGKYFGWKTKAVPKTPNNPRGIEDVPNRTTTTDEEGRRSVLGKMAFAELVAFVQRFGAEQGVLIPDPDPELRSVEEAA